MSEANLESVRLQAKEAGNDIEMLVADLLDPQTCRNVVAEAVDRLGGIEVFLHAIGRNVRRPWSNSTTTRGPRR